MLSPKLPHRQRLRGTCVLLSVDVPSPERRDDFKRVPEAPLRIEEAVIALARAIFIDGGTLVSSAHPGFSTLLARLAVHYHLPVAAESSDLGDGRPGSDVPWVNPSVVMYQSKAWEKLWAERSQRLERHPLVQFRWTDAAPREPAMPTAGDQPQAPRSMTIMRRAMMEGTSPAALIVVGGTEASQAEAELFTRLRPRFPIFALPTTGGAAGLLAGQPRFANRLFTPDLVILRQVV